MIEKKVDVTGICRRMDLFECYLAFNTEQLATRTSKLLTLSKLGQFLLFKLRGGNHQAIVTDLRNFEFELFCSSRNRLASAILPSDADQTPS